MDRKPLFLASPWVAACAADETETGLLRISVAGSSRAGGKQSVGALGASVGGVGVPTSVNLYTSGNCH